MSRLLRGAALAGLVWASACGGNSDDGGGGGGGGDGSESGRMVGITAAHNAARAAVSPAPASPMPALAWSSDIAAVAQAWADGCKFQHSGGQYGENLYASTNQSTVQDVVDSWVGEKKDYDYASNSCSGVCGHYTQVVWAKSLRLGCAVKSCSGGGPFGGGSWELWVCNYDPPGNFVGQKPY
jgi:pathogenesis-related protein 1